MRYGIFSDVHSNLEAFETVLDSYQSEDIDEYICVGDIVGYGADPSPCIDIVKKLTPCNICGNHDRAVCGLFDVSYFNAAAREAALWTRDVIPQEDLDYLKSLELTCKKKEFVVVHGSLQSPESFNYILSSYDAYKTIERMQVPVCFVGHSHVAGVFLFDGEKMGYSQKERIAIEPGKKYVINVGSVGQPRDGDKRASYACYDVEKKVAEIKRVSYDIEKAKNKILKANLPPRLAYRLLEGR